VQIATIKTRHRASTSAHIWYSALCCHSSETFELIANPLNSAQVEGTPYHSPKLCLGPCSSVGMQQGTDRHTDMHDQYTTRAKCNKKQNIQTSSLQLLK